MTKFTPKPNAVALATAAAAAEAGLDEQIREANLVLPIKDAMRDLAGKAKANVDAQFVAVVERFLGEPIGDPERLRDRLEHITGQGVEGTVYCCDGVPLLYVGPLELERQGDSIEARQDVRVLLADGAALYGGAAKDER